MSSAEDEEILDTLELYGFCREEVTCAPIDLLEVCMYLNVWLADPEIVSWCLSTSSDLCLENPIACLAVGMRQEVKAAGFAYSTSGKTPEARRLEEEAARRFLQLHADVESDNPAGPADVLAMPTGNARTARLARRRLHRPAQRPRPR